MNRRITPLLLLTGSILFSTFTQAQEDTATARQLDEVIVTGQFAPQTLKNSVYRVRTIKQQQIKLRGATDIAGVLNNELGVRFSNDYALGESDISIMGMGGQNVKILIDGVPLVDRGDMKQSLSQIDINTVERIELVEGPMSVVYGTDALAGVINIITKKQGTGNQFSVNARIQEEGAGKFYNAFSKSGVHNEHLGLSWQNNGFRLSAYGTRNDFGGWGGNAVYPEREWKPKEQLITGGTIGFYKNAFNIWYRLDYLNEDIEAAGKVNVYTYKAKNQNFVTDRFTHQLQAEWQLNKSLKLNGSASYQDYKRTTETYAVDYTDGTKTPSTNAGEWDVSKFQTAFFRGTAQWYISPKVSLQPGIEFKSDKTSGQRIEGNPDINDYAFFVSSELKPLSWLLVRPGVRFIKNSVYDAPPVIPSLNAKLALNNNLDVRLSYARGFRAPALRELYFYFFDASHSIEGNPNLEAEHSNSYMGSLNWQAVNTRDLGFQTAVSGFFNDFKNRIDLAQAANSNVYTYINISRYKTTGVTWENTFTYKNLSATLGATYIGRYNTLFDEPSLKQFEQDKFTWSPELNSNIIYKFPRLGAQAGFFYKFTGKTPLYRVGFNTSTSQDEVYLSETGSYSWADLTASKTIFKYITLQAGIKNLFDVTRLSNSVSDAGSPHSGGGPVLTAYGRSYFAGISFQWTKK